MSQLGLPVISGTSALNKLPDRILTDGLGHLQVVISGSSSTSTIDAADGFTGSSAPLYAIQTGGQDANGSLQANKINYIMNQTNQVSVGASPTLIIAANATRAGVLITNPSASVTVYLGGASVSTSIGQILSSGNSITLPVSSAIYGIVASSTQTVSFVELT